MHACAEEACLHVARKHVRTYRRPHRRLISVQEVSIYPSGKPGVSAKADHLQGVRRCVHRGERGEGVGDEAMYVVCVCVCVFGQRRRSCGSTESVLIADGMRTGKEGGKTRTLARSLATHGRVHSMRTHDPQPEADSGRLAQIQRSVQPPHSNLRAAGPGLQILRCVTRTRAAQ